RACDLSGAQRLRRTADQGRSGSARVGPAGSGRCIAGACLATGSAGAGRCAAACVVTAPTSGQAARGRNSIAAFGKAAREAGQACQANHLRLAAQPRLEAQALVLDLHVLKSCRRLGQPYQYGYNNGSYDYVKPWARHPHSANPAYDVYDTHGNYVGSDPTHSFVMSWRAIAAPADAVR